MTPKAFIHKIHEICRADLQHVVLPEVRPPPYCLVIVPCRPPHTVASTLLHLLARLSTSTCLCGRPMLSLPPALLQAQSSDRRVLAAAAEIMKKGLARITLLGKPEEVRGHLGLPAAGKGAAWSAAH